MSEEALEQINTDVDAALLAENVSPSDRDRVRGIVERVVGDYTVLAAQAMAAPLANPSRTIAELVLDICDYGVLGELFRTPGIEDIWVYGETIRYFWQGRWKAPSLPTTERRNRHVIMRLLADAGVPLDTQSATVDGVQVLGGTARLAGAIPRVSTKLDVVIRLYVERRTSLEELIAGTESTVPMLSAAAAALLKYDLRAQGTILVSGETGSGKTTLASALLGEADPTHMVRLIEEYREMYFGNELGGPLQIVPGPDDGRNERTIAGLIRLALRLHSDIIAVGEVRGPDAWELSGAAGVGAGCLCTLHAPNATRALERLALLSRGHADRPELDAIRETFSHLVHFVAHCERGIGPEGDYLHQVTEIRVVAPPLEAERGFTSEAVFGRPDGLGTPMRWTKVSLPEAIEDRIQRVLPAGVDLRDLLEGL